MHDQAMPQEQESAPLLKDLLNPQALARIGHAAAQVHPAFDAQVYLARACEGLETLSIMQRMGRAADSLRGQLPADTPQALALVRQMAPLLPRGFAHMVLPELVGRHGLDHFELSLQALRELTPYSSAEFAIRPFIAQDPEGVLAQALRWAEDDNEHVRRLASEGTRPRLPLLQAEPQRAWLILEKLSADPSAYVRRSVANHLNDMAKDHAAWVLDQLAGWPRERAETQWIVKHALRNLIKAGHPRALQLVGVTHGAQVQLKAFALSPSTLRLGQTLQLQATLHSTARQTQKLVVDYAIHYVKKNGTTSRKVFKLRTLQLGGGAELRLEKKQTLADFTTRVHYPGRHTVELLVNGQTLAQGHFDLKRPAS